MSASDDFEIVKGLKVGDVTTGAQANDAFALLNVRISRATLDEAQMIDNRNAGISMSALKMATIKTELHSARAVYRFLADKAKQIQHAERKAHNEERHARRDKVAALNAEIVQMLQEYEPGIYADLLSAANLNQPELAAE